MELKDILILIVILVIALLMRLYKINTPLADIHSWRQADTAAVARNYARDGIDLLHPRYDDLSSIESGIDNPNGYRMVEFPIYQAIVAVVYKTFPFLPIEVYGRLVSALFSLVIIAVIYCLLFWETGRLSAIVAAGVYAIFPFFVFFSRVVLPETTALAFSFSAIFFLYLTHVRGRGGVTGKVFIYISAVLFSLGVLVKPTVIFYLLPIVYLFFRKWGLANTFKKISFYFYPLIVVIPLLIWRTYIQKYPEGIPANDWLFTHVNTYLGLQEIFFRPAFFRWIFFERLNNMILGGFLSFFFILGILRRNKSFFYYAFLVAALIFLLTFQGGNVQHEYYQTIILPVVAIFIGLGADFLNRNSRQFNSPILTLTLTICVFALSFFFSYYRIREFYNYPSDLTAISRVIRTLTKPEDRIITDRLGDTTLLYLSDRKGWPAYTSQADELAKRGYRYLVTANKDLINDYKSRPEWKLLFENGQFSIFAL